MVSRLAFAVLTLCATTALADTGDVSFGPILSGALPAEGRLGGQARLGVGDWLALDVRLAAGLDQDAHVAGVGDIAVVAAWDVLAWVPELRVGGGAHVTEDGADPRVLAEVGVRHYLSFELSLFVSAGAEWRPSQWSAVATIGILFDLAFSA